MSVLEDLVICQPCITVVKSELKVVGGRNSSTYQTVDGIRSNLFEK